MRIYRKRVRKTEKRIGKERKKKVRQRKTERQRDRETDRLTDRLIYLIFYCTFDQYLSNQIFPHKLLLDGHWVILQNIHLVKTWPPSLEKKIEEYSEGAHASYRIFLSAEPAPNPGTDVYGLLYK
jgi:hypothetical protein